MNPGKASFGEHGIVGRKKTTMSAVRDMMDAYCADTSVSGERGYVCEFVLPKRRFPRARPWPIGSRAEKNAAVSLQEVCNKGRRVQ